MSKLVMVEDRYQVSINEAGIMKLWLWFYRDKVVFVDNESSLDTCKIFWGFVFLIPLMVIASIAAAVFYPLGAIKNFLGSKMPEPKYTPIDWDALAKARTEKLEKEKARQEKFENFTMKLGQIWARISKPVSILAFVVIGAIFLVAIFALVITIVNNLTATLTGLLILLAAVAGALVGAGIVFGLLWLFTEKMQTGKFLKFLFHTVHNHTCAVVEIRKD